MKLLFIYTHNKGLLSLFFKEISKKLTLDGYEVHTFYLKKKSEHFEEDGVKFWGEKKKSLVKNYLQTYKVIKSLSPDIVISNFGYINPALLCGSILGVKRNIAWFHTAYGHSKRHWFHVWFKKQCFKLAETVITNSGLLSLDMNKYYDVPYNKLIEIPFWTQISSVSELPIATLNEKQFKGLKIGCPGRLVADKNHALALKTLASFDATFSWNLFIAGSGPYKKELNSLVKSLSIEEQVHFLGSLSSQEMVTFYRTMDLIVLPSLHEAFGMVFLESIALGVPVLVSNRFGALSFIDSSKFDVSSFTFDPDSEKSLKEKLRLYFLNHGLSGNFFKELYCRTFDEKQSYAKLVRLLSESSIDK